MSRIQKFRMFNAGETSGTPSNLSAPSLSGMARGYNPYGASSRPMMPQMGYGYNRMSAVQSPTTIRRATNRTATTVMPTKSVNLGSGKSKRSITGETFNVPVTKRAKSKKAKEPLCDCGMPISKCQCEGHEHKMKNKKTKGVGSNMSKNFVKAKKLRDILRTPRRNMMSRVRYPKALQDSKLNTEGGYYTNTRSSFDVLSPKELQSALLREKKISGPRVVMSSRPELTTQEKVMRGINKIGPYMQGIPAETSRMARNFFGNILTNIGNMPLKNLVTVPMKSRKKNDLIPEYLPASGLDDGTKRVLFTTAISESTRPTRAKMMRMLSQQNRKKLKNAANIVQFGVLPIGTGVALGRAYENAYGEKEKSSGANSSMKKSITRMGNHVIGGYRGKSISKAMKSSQANLSNKYM